MGVAANLKLFLMEREYNVHDDSNLNEMSNLTKDESGLDHIVYVSTKQGVNHGPRVKVGVDKSNYWTGKTFTVTIQAEPVIIGDTEKIKRSELNDIVDWVKLNREYLLHYWHQKDKEGNFYSDANLRHDLKKF